MFGDVELAWVGEYETALARIRAIEEQAADPQRDDADRDALIAEHAAAGHLLLDIFVQATRRERGTVKSIPDSVSLPRPTDHATAILRYYQRDDGWTLVLSGTDGHVELDLPAHPAEIAGSVYEMLDLSRSGGASPIAPCRSLYDTIFATAERHLEGVSRIELLVDGPLASLPFASLHDGDAFLVDRFAFAYRSAAGTTPTEPRPRRDLALFGVSRSWHDLAPLRHVGDEIAAAARAFPRARRRLDRRFTSAALRRALANRPGAVHIASHYHLVPGSPTRSFLLLGDGERMPISAFLSEGFDWSGTNLLFLSACETMTGDTNFSGAATLAGALHLRGLDALVASIWPLADVSSAELVARFYGCIAAGMNEAAALREAQRALLSPAGRNGGKGDLISRIPCIGLPSSCSYRVPEVLQ